MPDGANANFAALFKTQAHVFEINPETKKEWVYKIKQAVPISIVASLGPSNLEIGTNEAASERGLKIVATYPNGEVAIDAFIHKDPRITFTKRTERFGQWLDQSEVLHGLGFSSEADLDSFMAAFQKLQREFSNNHHQQQQQLSQQSPPHSTNSSQQQPQTTTSQQQQQQQQQVTKISAWTQQQQQQQQSHQINNNTSEINGRFPPNKTGSSGIQHQQYSNTLGRPQIKRDPVHNSNGNTSLNNGNTTTGENTNNNYPRSQSMFGLQTKSNKSERSSPDQALTSPMNVNQNDWQAREQLKYENERLKQILEENAKISKDWQNELLNLRTNNIKLTQALQESKAHVQQWVDELSSLREENQKLKLKVLANDSEQENDYEKELQKYVDERLQDELRRKDEEIQELLKSMDALTIKAAQSGKNQNGQPDANQNNSYLRLKLENINTKFESEVLELSRLQKELKQLVTSEKLEQ